MNYSQMLGVVVMSEDGTPLHTFDSMVDCGRYYGLSGTAIGLRIKAGSVVNGLRFVKKAKDETFDGIPNLSPKRDRGLLPSPKKRNYKEFKSDDVDMSIMNYPIVKYEVRYKRVCITRCTVLDQPQPLIGSGECAKCPYFKGRNRKTHEVACSNQLRKLK